MTGAIAHLKAILGMDSKEFKAGMKDATKSTTTFQSDLKKVGSMIAGAFSVTAVVGFSKALFNWASDVSEAAQNAGVLTSEMMALNQVGLKGGLGFDELRRLMAKMQTELKNAADGSEESRKKFDDLNLSIVELSGMGAVEALQAVSKAAFASGIPLEQIAEIFGERLGPKAVAALRDLTDNGLGPLNDAAADAADAAEALGDRWAAAMDSAKQKTLELVMATIDGAKEAFGYVQGATSKMSKTEKAIRLGLAPVTFGASLIPTAKQNRAGIESAISVQDKNAAKSQARTSERQAQIDAANKARKERARANEEKRSREIGAMADNAEQLGDLYEEEAAKARKEREDKEQARKDAIKKREDAAIKSFKEKGSRIFEQMDALKEERAGPAQIQSDGLSRIGGFMGNERSGFDVASKQLAIQRETKDLLEELVALDKELIESITAIRTGATI